MTGKELRKLLEHGGLNQSEAARAIEIGDRTMRRYIAGDLDIPRTVEYALLYVIEHKITEPRRG